MSRLLYIDTYFLFDLRPIDPTSKWEKIETLLSQLNIGIDITNSSIWSPSQKDS